jgi:hypothetical protein
MKKTDKKPQPGWSPKSARTDLSRAETAPTSDQSLDFTRESIVREIRRSGAVITA